MFSIEATAPGVVFLSRETTEEIFTSFEGKQLLREIFEQFRRDHPEDKFLFAETIGNFGDYDAEDEEETAQARSLFWADCGAQFVEVTHMVRDDNPLTGLAAVELWAVSDSVLLSEDEALQLSDERLQPTPEEIVRYIFLRLRVDCRYNTAAARRLLADDLGVSEDELEEEHSELLRTLEQEAFLITSG